jgi:hypothetical protein
MFIYGFLYENVCCDLIFELRLKSRRKGCLKSHIKTTHFTSKLATTTHTKHHTTARIHNELYNPNTKESVQRSISELLHPSFHDFKPILE